jgi:hypothetical protein
MNPPSENEEGEDDFFSPLSLGDWREKEDPMETDNTSCRPGGKKPKKKRRKTSFYGEKAFLSTSSPSLSSKGKTMVPKVESLRSLCLQEILKTSSLLTEKKSLKSLKYNNLNKKKHRHFPNASLLQEFKTTTFPELQASCLEVVKEDKVAEALTPNSHTNLFCHLQKLALSVLPPSSWEETDLYTCPPDFMKIVKKIPPHELGLLTRLARGGDPRAISLRNTLLNLMIPTLSSPLCVFDTLSLINFFLSLEVSQKHLSFLVETSLKRTSDFKEDLSFIMPPHYNLKHLRFFLKTISHLENVALQNKVVPDPLFPLLINPSPSQEMKIHPLLKEFLEEKESDSPSPPLPLYKFVLQPPEHQEQLAALLHKIILYDSSQESLSLDLGDKIILTAAFQNGLMEDPVSLILKKEVHDSLYFYSEKQGRDFMEKCARHNNLVPPQGDLPPLRALLLEGLQTFNFGLYEEKCRAFLEEKENYKKEKKGYKKKSVPSSSKDKRKRFNTFQQKRRHLMEWEKTFSWVMGTLWSFNSTSSLAQKGMEDLNSLLKNPASLKIHHIPLMEAVFISQRADLLNLLDLKSLFMDPNQSSSLLNTLSRLLFKYSIPPSFYQFSKEQLKTLYKKVGPFSPPAKGKSKFEILKVLCFQDDPSSSLFKCFLKSYDPKINNNFDFLLICLNFLQTSLLKDKKKPNLYISLKDKIHDVLVSFVLKDKSSPSLLASTCLYQALQRTPPAYKGDLLVNTLLTHYGDDPLVLSILAHP